jgi:thiamine pyrophosphokinase
MSPDILQFKTPTILFGNGVTPTHPAVLKKIREANSILCVDGGADKLEKIGYNPDLIFGDLDSLIHDPGKYE